MTNRKKMKLTQYFFPTLRDNPQEAQIVSHKLMLRAGFVTQSSSGIYSWLPMGLKVLNKISDHPGRTRQSRTY